MPRRYDDELAQLPPRIQTALKFLDHTHWITRQDDISVPARTLTPLERSVEAAALKAIQSYLLGEMDFAETPAREPRTPPDEEPPAVPQPQPA